MLLRRSGDQTETEFQLQGVTSDGTPVGVAGEALLLALTDAIFAGEPGAIEEARTAAISGLGEAPTLDAIGVAAAFNGITKIANATGIPLDESTQSSTVEMRQVTGIDRYAEQHKSRLYDESV